MYKLTIEDKTYSCQPDETVLDALLRENVNISYACKKALVIAAWFAVPIRCHRKPLSPD